MSKQVWILIITALIILCLTACKSPAEKRLEEAQEAARRAEEAADQAQAEYDRLMYLMDRYEECQELISTLVPGSYEYEQAVEENNRIVRQLVAEYPEFGDFVE